MMVAPSFLLFLVNIVLTFCTPSSAIAASHYKPPHHPPSAIARFKNENSQEIQTSESSPPLDPTVLKMALHAVKNADKLGIKHRNILAIIDYSVPSTQKRLWVLNLNNHKINYQTLVAHGKGSGENVAHHFSNQGGSRASSLGLFVAGDTYFGHHGYSLRIKGLEHGFNDNALRRDVVIHAANYVSREFLQTHGRLGRSWGCPAIPPKVSHELINTLKNGALIFAYFPDSKWLNHSRYLA